MGKLKIPKSQCPGPNAQSLLPTPRRPMPNAQYSTPHLQSRSLSPFPKRIRNIIEKTINSFFISLELDKGQYRTILRKASHQLWKSQRRVAGKRRRNAGAVVSGGPPALDMHPLLGREAEAQKGSRHYVHRKCWVVIIRGNILAMISYRNHNERGN